MKVLTSTLVTLTCIVSSVFCRTESVIRVEKKEGGCHKYRDVEGAAKAIDQLGILRDDPNISHYIKALYADEDRPDMFHKEIVVREVCTFTKPVTNSEEVTTIIKPFVLNYYTKKTTLKKEGCKYSDETGCSCHMKAEGANNDFVEYKVCETDSSCVISATLFDLKKNEFRNAPYENGCYFYVYTACQKYKDIFV